jgi:multidrug resistance efflux pump
METFVRRAAIKWAYLLALIGGLGWLGNWLAAGYLYPQGEGIVIGEPAVVAAEFTATVKSIPVEAGQAVAQGDVVAKITSQSVAESRARLTAEAVQRSAKLAEMRIRNEIVNATLESAETREHVASEGQDRINTLYKNGYSPNITRTEAAVQAYRGIQDAEALRAEQRALGNQLHQLSKASEAADSALSDLLALFDNGQVRAPIRGTISVVLASPGSVVRAGDPMLEIVGEHQFVISWFPMVRLFGSHGYELAVGRSVTMDSGHGVLTGKIARISTVAGPLPREFQRSFAPTERQQIIRIEFDEGVVPPPYFTKVTVR